MSLILGMLRAITYLIIKTLEYVLYLTSFPHYLTKSKKCPPITNPLLLYTATDLAEKIRNRQIKCQSIIQAYITRIVTVNPVINAVVEDRFLDALKKAKSVDNMLANSTITAEKLKTKYPLLGIPITIKGCISVKGMDHGSGRVFPNGKKASKDAPVVQLIKAAGAIPLLVSNTPELCMALETFNNVTGTTNNPYDTRRTPGGSSGGEAALLGSGASLIGIGSDLIGSIRVPAHYCGIWGHKPTAGTISLEGHYPDSREKDVWTALLTIGPMCRYASDLPLLYKVMSEKPVNVEQPVSLKNLKYYMMENDGGSILTHPVEQDIIHAMRKFKIYIECKHRVKVKLLKMDDFTNVETMPLKVLNFSEIDTIFDENAPGPYRELLRFITGQSKSTSIPILQGILHGMIKRLPPLTRSWADLKLTQTKEKLLEILGEDGVLLYPSHPRAAHIHGQMIGRYFDYYYTGVFNGLGCPVTSCPIGLNSYNLPIGMQVIAAPNNDRLTFAVAREVEVAFGGWIPPSSAADK